MSKKIKLILGILVLFAGFLIMRIGLTIKKSVDLANRVKGESTVIPQEESFLTKDTDGDGLSDYDEIIYATKVDQKDTDGDGFFDGEEIATGHDPLDPDSYSVSPGKTLGVAHSANLTDRLLSLSVANMIDDTGEYLDPNMISEKVYADILESVNVEGTLSLFVPPVSDSDIKISQSNDPESIKKYINSVSATVESVLMSSSGGIYTGLSRIGDSNSNYFTYYLNTYNALKEIEVPSSWSEIHKSILTSFLQLAKSFQVIRGLDEDPIRATFAINQIQEVFFNIQLVLNQASRLAKSQDISTEDSIIETLKSSDPTIISP